MKETIRQELQTILQQEFKLPIEYPIPVEHTRIASQGDFSTSIALILTKSLKIQPHELAKKIVAYLNQKVFLFDTLFQKVEVVQPGFINFYIHPNAWHGALSNILQDKIYGQSNFGKHEKILIEFVSSNPTGPLHVGHGRAAAHGDMVVRLLKTLGYDVQTEYYVNDAGKQIDILTCSVWLRYLMSFEKRIVLPVKAYQGSYIQTIADALIQHFGAELKAFTQQSIETLLSSDALNQDPDQQINHLISCIKKLLGSRLYQKVLSFITERILAEIQSDLSEFKVNFDRWFSEKTLIEDKSVSKTIIRLKDSGYTYQAQGNLWFRSTAFGDDKDRVLLRNNGQPTYFAVDAAYRLHILEIRDIKHIINFLGADHHGYLTRIHAVLQALGYSKEHITFKTLQLVSLYRGSEKLPLSTRSGEFITLRELRSEVGNDAARVFFVLRKSNQKLDFDLSLAQSQSHQNPMYYLQYAHARICSVMHQLKLKNMHWTLKEGLVCLDQLKLIQELQLIKQLVDYPEVVLQAGTQYEPYLLVQYLKELSKSFHGYYNSTALLMSEERIRMARISLIQAIKTVLKNGFDILGIQALESM